MGVAEESRQAASSYHSEVADVVDAVRDLADLVDGCRHRLSPQGPIGGSADPDLERARLRLDVAHQRLTEAAQAARGSKEPVQRYLERTFPA
jgi:hypothetical protein